MEAKLKKSGPGRGLIFISLIILVFFILGAVVFSVARKISREMSESAIVNLSESLGLIGGTMETILDREAEFQQLIADRVAESDDPAGLVLSYSRNKTMIKISLVLCGQSEGISNTGEPFYPQELDFSNEKTAGSLPVSRSYLNSLGTWAYTMKCPLIKEDTVTGDLYIEYIYDSFDEALPDTFYNTNATLYLMDSISERLVLKPKGLGERDAGHLNLEDFYRSNNILEKDILEEVGDTIRDGKNMMFYHDIRGRESLIYVWAVNGGSLYLIGYVPTEAIQREGKAVNQNILVVVVVMLTAFVICCLLYFLTDKQQRRIRREREKEREIHNRQLAEALEAAQIANRSKTTFLSNMSHDIRTPMNAILGFTTLLAKDAENPVKVREYTRKITASGQHLLGLINDVLDVSKIESGKMALSIAEFTLSDLLSSLDAIIRPAARARKQTFDISVTGIRHEYLMGDETRLSQVLINLLSNAVKYTPEGGNIWLRIIGLEQHASQFEHIRIEVEDNGYGMTPEYLRVIFDAFTRAENSTTNKVQGTGLGMAITKNIVELMGGTIQVFSEVDKGSLFRVDLELRIQEGHADKQFWKEHGIFRLLAVDSDPDLCGNLKALVEEAGVAADTALSGEAALSLVGQTDGQGSAYDVILLEQNLPGMDGIETAKRLRALVGEQTLILLLTSCDCEEVAPESEKAGVYSRITKPFFISALKEKILEFQASRTRGQADLISDGAKRSAQEAEGILDGRHFLVAEDNVINAEILSELLCMEGADCKIAENGQIVLEWFRQAPPDTWDAILMDVQMPVMNGYEATRAIRALPREDAVLIPIIAMTANAFAEDVKDALAAGMNAHVAKPVDMELLKRTLARFLK